MTLFSPWQWFCSTRTFSNCLETTMTIAALYFWPWAISTETVLGKGSDVSQIEDGDAEPISSKDSGVLQTSSSIKQYIPLLMLSKTYSFANSIKSPHLSSPGRCCVYPPPNKSPNLVQHPHASFDKSLQAHETCYYVGLRNPAS